MKYNAFHRLSYGLYIVTTRLNDKNSGYVGNTVFQVTSHPPQIAISCHKNNDSLNTILQSKIFAISVLGENSSTSLIGEFGFMSGKEMDKFHNKEILTSKTGAPIVIDSAIAWFDCKVVSSIDVGSHIIIIGEVLDSDVISDDEPLTYAYYREKYKMLSPKNSPTYIEKDKLEPENKKVKKSIKSQEQQKEPKAGSDMDEYICTICGYHYNPEEGDPSADIPPGTPFDKLPDDYKCPICNAPKEYFKKA